MHQYHWQHQPLVTAHIPLPCCSPAAAAAAAAVCRLDFKGTNIPGSGWNAGYKDVITVLPYSTDADRASFTTAEKYNMVAIWRGVAEDYAMFNVDVTTVDQIAAGTLPQNYMRVCIGGNSVTTLDYQAGGVAYVGVWGYDHTSYQPAFVFPDQLSSGWPK
jgi:hypothetical protein